MTFLRGMGSVMAGLKVLRLGFETVVWPMGMVRVMRLCFRMVVLLRLDVRMGSR